MKPVLSLLLLFFFELSLAQQTDYVDFKHCKALVKLDTVEKSVEGTVRFQFDILKRVDSIYIDAKNMQITKPLVLMTLPSKQLDTIDYVNDKDKIWIKNSFLKGKPYELILSYKTVPKKALYFVGWDNEAPNQIWTQGQGKYTSNWLPSFDDMNEKVEFDISISTLKGYEVISNGVLTHKSQATDERLETWYYDMKKPMSSYLIALAIGKYDKRVETSKSGIPLEMYYYPEDSLKVEPTYRYTKQMFDFLEEEIGVAYPWQNYKQVPVHDFLYAGMENTSATIFSDGFVVDSIGFNDKNYVNVNAHELAHQWFGDLVTETSGTHHWLQEGFATYYALLAERQVFGDNYYYWRLYEYAQELLDQDNRGAGTALLDPKSSSTTFYKRGAWVLHALKELVGEEVFRQAVKNYLNKYQFKNVETANFIEEVEGLYEKPLGGFTSEWLEAKSFPYNQAMASLENSVFIQEYLMADCEAKTSKCDYFMEAPLSDEAKSKVIAQVPERVTVDVFQEGLKVRQAIAKHVVNIPISLKTVYESLLDDKSYVTIEYALYNLWNNFPEERSKYLNKTKRVIGLNDKNVRLLWLVLAISTPDYFEDNKQAFFNELVNYTAPDYGFEVRMGAFSYLDAIGLFPEQALEHLVEASHHHSWQFKQFANRLLDKLSNDDGYAQKIQNIKNKS
ncbi:aminopeptidase [Hanstruepera neustonica]|uniref:Aminopeptidase N n=1 Tax=Hanstruepera neustonica TaxID=1445657 RepID=A0A2K1DXB0_9FLAO|nr:M1 family metallopeptidase [Hanstruepera neustonica]PNQ72633.1 aminopeptidase [Hanstruepera neustonica]